MCLALSRLSTPKPNDLASCSLAELKIEQVDAFSLSILGGVGETVLVEAEVMRCLRCDQCQFGMTSVDRACNVGPANDEYIAQTTNKWCFGGHDHIQLLKSSTVDGSDTECLATEHESRGMRPNTEEWWDETDS